MNSFFECGMICMLTAAQLFFSSTSALGIYSICSLVPRQFKLHHDHVCVNETIGQPEDGCIPTCTACQYDQFLCSLTQSLISQFHFCHAVSCCPKEIDRRLERLMMRAAIVIFMIHLFSGEEGSLHIIILQTFADVFDRGHAF
jgi:hypothetical protein